MPETPARRSLACVVFLALLALGSAAAVGAEHSPVVAVVAGDPLTQAELEQLFDALSPEERASYHGPRAQQLRAFLEEYLKRVPLAQEAKTQGLQESPRVRAAVELARSRALYEELLQQVVLPAQFSQDQIAEAYEIHRERFRRPASYAFRQITINPGPSRSLTNESGDDAQGPTEVLMKRRRIDDMLESEQGFGEIARQLSEDRFAARDGQVPPLRAEQLEGSFARELPELEVGQVSDWFESGYGWHRVQLVAREAGGVPPLHEIRREVITLLAEERLEELRPVIESLRRKLSEKYEIEAYPDRIR